MTFNKQVEKLLNDALLKREDLFLIDFKIDDQNKITVVIDGDQGVLLSDCIEISRAIEHNIDRDEHDFSLEVTSSGALSPIVNNRQYNKNIGRLMSVVDVEGVSYEGVLEAVNDESITLVWKSRQPKKVGKGKETVIENKTFLFKDINKSQVIIKI